MHRFIGIPRAASIAVLIALLMGLVGWGPAPRLHAAQLAPSATFTVTKTADTNDGVCNADCSLREAIIAANAAAGADTISVPAGTYLLTRTGSDDTASGGDLDLTGPTTITGAGAGLTLVDSNVAYRVFHIIGAQTITLSDLTIQRGGNQSSGSAVHVTGGALTLTNVALLSNTVSSTGNGGALYFSGGSLTMSNSALSGNSAGNNGGAIYTTGAVSLTISASAFYSNSAKNGGGLFLNTTGTASFLNSTLSANSATSGTGGGVRNFGTLTLTHVTFSGNSASAAGGAFRTSGTATLKNTLLANSPTGGNCSGTFTSSGGNLSSDGTCAVSLTGPGDQNNVNPLLDVLQNNGGPTLTHALLAGSPAINTGNLGSCLPTDQRGVARDAQCDIGAYETSAPAATATATATDTITPTASATTTDTIPSTTPTAGPTSTPSATPSPSGTPTASMTDTPSATSTSAPSATDTPLPPSATNTSAPTATDTATPSATHTLTPSATHTPSPVATSTPTATHTLTPPPSPTGLATLPPPTPGTIRFAVIGDFGLANQNELDVANRVKSWNPDFIVTVGDNNYPDGEATTIDANIGQYYHDYIFPYLGAYGAGSPTGTNRFWPALGNHDWVATNAEPYLDYFTLPGNERYYTFTVGVVEFFVIDSDANEPDGRTSTSVQANWLQSQMTASTAPWQLVFFHHAPYASGSTHGGQSILNWPFKTWGADAVVAGHEHNYERLIIDDLLYFVNGLGGASRYSFSTTPVPGSQARYSDDYGAMLVEANVSQITFQFVNRAGTVIDTYTLLAGSNPTPTPTITPTPTATLLPGGSTFTVTKTDDTNDGACNGDCSLREAISAANAAPGANTIVLPAGTYRLTLTGTDDNNAAGDLDITGALTLTGAGAGVTFIDGNAQQRVFHVVNAVAVSLSGVTIQNGGNTNSGGGLYNNGGAVTLTNSVIYSNTVTASVGNGAGVYLNGGSLTLESSTVNTNTAGNNGGAFYLTASASLTITGSTLNHNSAKNGGALYLNSGVATFTNSTLSANAATSGSGGAIRNVGTLTLLNVTLNGNSATGGAGGALRTTGTATVKNTLLANSPAGSNCSGTFTSQGGNLSSDGSCTLSLVGTGDQNNANPQLGSLQDNSGPTWTHALLSNSPAINAGQSAGCPITDQRGLARDGQCDMGAYEFGAGALTRLP